MRHRNMYKLTGQPGWMRFGYSPGWLGRSALGCGPLAAFLTTDQWQMIQDPDSEIQGTVFTNQPVDKSKTQLGFLMSNAELLEQQHERIRAQIESLEGVETR